MKVKIKTGYRQDQFLTIDADEAHKAYFLFLNPEARTVFRNGVALIGKDIRGIVPDYHATMGWNPTHQLTSDDYNEMRSKGTDVLLTRALESAKEYAEMIQRENRLELLSKPMDESTLLMPPKEKELPGFSEAVAKLSDNFSIKNINN